MPTLPRQLLIAPTVESRALAAPGEVLLEQLRAWDGDDWTGREVAVAVGSRGIDHIGLVAATLVGWLRARGARPFILPAMGSHGGGTPEGQADVLDGYGVSEATVGAPVRASMDVERIGTTPAGVPVHLSRLALAADAVILVNRVKPHTDFDSAVTGSGLVKMSAIGLGKAEGAFACHFAAATLGHERVLQEVSAAVLARLPRVYGVALVEDGLHHLARIEVMRRDEIADREPPLLVQARQWMPALPFADVDLLIVDEIGKDISGTGMDTNIIGRGVDGQLRRTRRSTVRIIYARRLTPGSHGNAIGIGLADVISSTIVAEMDPVATYTNAISAMTPVPPRISINFPTDAECLRAAIRLSAADQAAPRIVRIRSTLALDRIVCSEAYAAEIAGRGDLRVLEPATEWRLDAHGNFDAATDLLQPAAVGDR